MTLYLTCNAPLQALFYEVQHEALQHLQHDASRCIFSFRGWSSHHRNCSAAQHLLGAAFAAVGGTPKGVCPLRAAEMLHYPTCTICSMMHHAAPCC
jgi:hypothetical protein